MKEEAVTRTSFFLPGVLTKKSKLFLLCILDSSCLETDAPAIEIAWKKLKVGWGALLKWARNYGQVNTQKERDCWQESSIREISSLYYSCSWWWISTAENWEVQEHVFLSPPFSSPFCEAFLRRPAPFQEDPSLRKDWKFWPFFFFF